MIHVLLLSLLLQRGAPPSGAGVVAGNLLYSDGTPAVAQTVSLAPLPGQNPAPSPQRVSRTDAAGMFRFAGIAPGRYTLRMDYPGIAPVYYPGVVGESAATVITAANAPVDGLQFRLPPVASGVRVSGRVVFPSNYGRPQNPPVVQVRGGVFQGIPVTSDGKFEIPHVRPGTYSLIVSPAPGMQPMSVVVPDRDVDNVELVVPRLIDVTGTVTADDRTRPGFTFGLVHSSLPTAPAAVANGTFSAQLPAGEYRITAQGVPTGYYFKAITAGSTNLLTSPLKIEGTEPVRIAVTLGKSAGVRVRGRVQDFATPTPSRRITLVDPIQLSSVEAPVAADGAFDFERVMPGNYLARLILTSSIGTPFVSVAIPDRNLSDLVVVSPSLREITGRVAVAGNGSLPRFTLLLVHGEDSLLIPAATPSGLPTIAPAAANVRAGIADTQVLSLDVNALPDGSFKIKVPQGKYRVALPPSQAGQGIQLPANLTIRAPGLPPAFFLRDISYGPARLLTEPFVVSDADNYELFIGFGTNTPNPWAKVSGRVVGASPVNGPYKVALTANTLSAAEAFVDPDGKFEFPRVLQGTAYTARLVPDTAVASAPRVDVADKDVAGVEIVVPAEREVTVKATVEGNGPVPTFSMVLRGTTSSLNILVKPEADGTFRTKFPEDERRIQINGLPLGYDVKAVTYGSANLNREPLKISTSSTADIVVIFELDPAVPMGSVRGRIRGLDADAGPLRLVLNGVAAYSSFEVPVDADGAFAFPKIPQGSYFPSLKGGAGPSRLNPGIVTITGSDLFAVDLEAKKGSNRTEPLSEDPPTGARLSDLSGGARETANENAATSNLRTLNTALVTYLAASQGNYGSLSELVSAGLIDGRFLNAPVAGFYYAVIGRGSTYEAVAIPVGDAGRFGLFSSPDAVVRYSTFEGLAPPRQAGNPVQ
jgi:hypothetical protein